MSKHSELAQQRPAIRLFGPLEIHDGERILGPRDLGGARPKQVLEILLTARGHRVPTDRLATATLASIQGGLILTQTRRDPGRLAVALEAAYAHLRAHASRNGTRHPAR